MRSSLPSPPKKSVMPPVIEEAPSETLALALREAGVPLPITRERLRELIVRSVGALPPHDRTTDELAQAVLGLARVGMLRIGSSPAS